MKLLRVGNKGQEKVAALDSNNQIRDLSSHIQNLSPDTLNESTLDKLSKVDLSKLKEIDGIIFYGESPQKSSVISFNIEELSISIPVAETLREGKTLVRSL